MEEEDLLSSEEDSNDSTLDSDDTWCPGEEADSTSSEEEEEEAVESRSEQEEELCSSDDETDDNYASEDEDSEDKDDEVGRERSQSVGSETSAFDAVAIKQLLMHLSLDLPEPPPQINPEIWNGDEDVMRRALLIYKSFLSEMVHLGTNLQAVAGISEDMISMFFGEPDEEPRFLSFSRGGDLGKLVRLLRVDIVIFSLSAGGENPRKFHDSRLLSCMGTEAEAERVRYFLLSRRAGTGPALEPVNPTPPPSNCYTARLSESFFIGHAVQKASETGDCFAAALLALLTYEPYNGPRCSDLRELCFHVTSREWIALPVVQKALSGRRVLLSFHAGTKFGRSKSSFTPENQSFQLLASFPRLRAPPDNVEMVPVCAVYPDYLYRPKERYLEAVVRGTRFTTSNPMRVQDAAKIVRGTPMAPPPRAEEEEDEPLRRSPCACEMCRQSQRLRVNFRPREGQKVMSTMFHPAFPPSLLIFSFQPLRCNPTITDYLEMFGMATEDNLRRFRRACDLTVASIDIEALTTELPRHVGDEHAEINAFTRLRYDSAPRKVQSVCVFAYLDRLEDGRTEPAYFRVSQQRTLKEVTVDFLEYLKVRKKLASRLKRELLAPMLRVVERLRQAHLRFYQEYLRREESTEKDMMNAYKGTLIGRFNEQLLQLVSKMVIFSFCGR